MFDLPYEKGIRLSSDERERLSQSMRKVNTSVLDYLKKSDNGLTADEAHKLVGGLLTSVRRSLSDLFKAGKVYKSGKRSGPYGVMTTVYKAI